LDLDFEAYKIVIAIEKTKSFSKAAKLLHLTQPAISRKIQIIESYYGVNLFHRTSNGVTLTDAGELFYSYACRFEQLHDSMTNDMNNVVNPIERKIFIGTCCITGSTLPNVINSYIKINKNINYKIHVSNPLTQLKALDNKVFDFIIVSNVFDKLNNNEYISHLLGFNEFILIAPNSGTWKNTNGISINELTKHPLIIQEPGATARIILESTLLDYGYSLDDCNIVSEMNNNYSVKSGVTSGWGLALVPKKLVEEDLNTNKIRNINIIEFKNEPLKMAFIIIYLKNNEMKKPAKQFVEYLIHNKLRYCESGIFC
jgi:DNA-binding transcriptional LysR family regulator